MRHVALGRLDEVGNQVVATLQLYIDLGEGVLAPGSEGNQFVIDAGGPEAEDHDNAENHEQGDDGFRESEKQR